MDDNKKRRVVVTGLGAVTPTGCSFTEFWENALAGKSGVSDITRFDTAEYPVKIAGEIKNFVPENYFDKKLTRRMDRFIQYAYAACLEAMQDASLDMDKVDRTRAGILLGSGIGGLETIEEQRLVVEKRGPGKVTPFLIPMTTIDMASGQISIYLGIQGPNYTVSSACATGNNAIGLAYKSIKDNETDVVFSGGTESAITRLCLAGFCAARALSTKYNNEPARASRPFDLDRDGFVVGEGGAVLILEELEHARKRGAKIYAEVLGFAATGDGYHLTAPHPEGDGAFRAMKGALNQANITPDAIKYINAHGTATIQGDVAECKAIARVFEGYKRDFVVSATKSLIGHLLGGAGAVGAACAVKSVSSGIVHPTINIDNQDPDCDLVIATQPEKHDVAYAMCNAFGFGGHNTCLVFGRYPR